jgi:hypothetical protein
MASEAQSKYIADLAVIKTKEFKEVKELLLSTGIVSDNADTVKNAGTIAEVTYTLTDLQASKFIDVLVSTKEPIRSHSYSPKRINKVVSQLDDIQVIINNWDFPE